MKGVQGSDSTPRSIIQNQTTDSIEPSKDTKSGKGTGVAESTVQSSDAEKKGAHQIAQQNKATQDLEASVRQQDLHSSLPNGGINLAPGKPPGQTPDSSKGSESADSPGQIGSSKLRSNPGEMIYADNGIAIFKKNGNHTVFGENKDLIPGKSKDGVNGVYVEDSNGKPHVFIFDKNGKDTIGHFEPKKFTPQQIVKMWEEERAKNPKASNEQINQAVLKRRDQS